MKIQYEEDSSNSIEINDPLNYDLALGIALSGSLHRNVISTPAIVKKRVEERLDRLLREN